MYTWKIKNVNVYNNYDNLTDVVYLVNYFIEYDEPGVGGSTLDDKQEVSTSDLSNFTPFDDLTESVVIGWVKDALGTDGVTQKETEAKNILNTSVKTL
tara:strand:+ start:5492 stop:5785 length:294 start_codon:yes stop_codon:yes gene_type:complete